MNADYEMNAFVRTGKELFRRRKVRKARNLGRKVTRVTKPNNYIM